MTSCGTENTDRHLWPDVSEHADADSIHVTKGGGIGINVGGHVIVMPLRKWFAAALACQAHDTAEDRLRSLAGSVPEGWKDISTAPKDGTWVILFGMHSRHGVSAQIVCRWDGNYWQSSDDGYGAYITPTNWRPLPAPPVASSPVALVAETTTIQAPLPDWLGPDTPEQRAKLQAFVEGISEPAPQTTVSSGLSTITKDWCETMARAECGDEIGAGSPNHPLRTLPEQTTVSSGEPLSNLVLAQRAHLVANMIEMGEKIAWGTETKLLRDLADALPSSSSAERARAIEALTVAHSALEQIRHESDCDDPEFEIIDRRHHQDLETAFQKIVVALRSLKQQENGDNGSSKGGEDGPR